MTKLSSYSSSSLSSTWRSSPYLSPFW